MASGSQNLTTYKANLLAHTPNDTSLFLRGDNIWTNILTGNFTANGNIIADKGHIIAYYDGESYVMVKNNNTTIQLYLDSDDFGNHGIWSTGWWNGSTYTTNGKWLIYRNAANKVLLAGHAEAATNLYADDSPYRYTDSNPYYAHMSFNTNGDNRWYLRVSPETPKVIAVDWAYDATKAGGIRDKGNNTVITAEYSGNGVSAFDWATVWDGYRLTYISKSDLMTQIRGVASGTWGIDISGNAATATKASKCSSSALTDIALTWNSSYSTGSWMLIYNGETGSNGGALFRAINQADTATWVDGTHKWVRLGGDNMSGSLSIYGTDNSSTDARLYIDHQSNNDWGIRIQKGNSYDYGMIIQCSSSASNALSVSGRITGTTVYGAVWNDYAEYRIGTPHAKPGQCVVETDTGIMQVSDHRLQAGAHIISDTFGFAIGQTTRANMPIAVAGRVLAYTVRPIEKEEIGVAVCSAPNGRVDVMTREEIITYPERIIGTISEIPDYDVWYAGQPSELMGGAAISLSMWMEESGFTLDNSKQLSRCLVA